MSNDKFTLCYKNNRFPGHWKCESGFESVKEADTRAFKLIDDDSNITTTLFPFNSQTPTLIQKLKIRYTLTKLYSPTVIMVEKEVGEKS